MTSVQVIRIDIKAAWERAQRLCRRLAPAVLFRRWQLRRRSLVTRLLALLLMGAGTVYLLGMMGLWWTADQLLERSLQKQALQWIAEIDELGPPVYVRRPGTPLFIETRIRNFPEVAFVRFYDKTGRHVIRTYGDASKVPLLTDRQLAKLSGAGHVKQRYVLDDSVPAGKSWFASHYVRVIAPIRVRSIRSDGMFNFSLDDPGIQRVRRVGYLDIGINPNVYREAIARTLLFGAIVGGFVLLAALWLGRRLIRNALLPLTTLQGPLSLLAKGNIDVRFEAKGHSEIVAIGRALNTTIGALKQRDETLRRLAEHDSLTGLPNRGCFSRLLETEIARVRDVGASSALLFIDLDRFKYINDVFGHAGGDRLLIELAGLIRRQLKSEDVVARFGGDEFTVLARDTTCAEALDLANDLNRMMRDFHFASDDKTFSVHCSIGIALITAGCSGTEELLLQADTACYEAKSGGRNRYHLYDARQDATSTLKDISWSALIKEALKENLFRLVYQPIVSLSSPQQEYYEVLVRMPDDQGRWVSPTAFLHIAERFGLLADLDRWVIDHALRALAGFRAEGRDIVFSINLSGQAFDDPSIGQVIIDALRANDVPPESVVFEITEQVAVRYMDKARRLMESLTDIGCRFALDDFGVGFSSFNYLKNFPVSLIKIDGSFVQNMAADATDRAMVRSIAQIARALGKQVVAEFVEDDATLQLLRQYRVDYVQGHHVARPSMNVPHRRFAGLAARRMRQAG